MTDRKRKTNKMALVGLILVMLAIDFIVGYHFFSNILPFLTVEISVFVLLPAGCVLSIIGFILSIKNKEKGKALAIFAIVICVAFFSSSEMKHLYMQSYLNENTDLKVVGIDEWFKSKDDKVITLNIELKRSSSPSKVELDSFRVAINNYMSKKGGFLERGWKVTVIVAEDRFLSSKAPNEYARFKCGNNSD